MNVADVYKIRDSVDLFLTDQSYLTAYYMNTRQRKCFHVNNEMIFFLENIDGQNSLYDLQRIMCTMYAISGEQVTKMVETLINCRIVTKVNHNPTILPDYLIERYKRQINYFAEFLESDEAAIHAQKRLIDSRVLIFGCGAVGGQIAMELAMAGIGNITLFDHDVVEPADVARHMYYKVGTEGQFKADILARELKKINSEINVTTICEYLKPNTDLDCLISSHGFVINTLDEPYIGYTAAKISRVCMKYRIPHYIAGGFDAHLSSTGELIIPYKTPCVECYADHFKEKLKNWKPNKHPVDKRYQEIGGLACLSLFSASYACIEIIKCIAGLVEMEKCYKIRGEFLFHDMSLSYLDVKRNPHCPICGGKEL